MGFALGLLLAPPLQFHLQQIRHSRLLLRLPFLSLPLIRKRALLSDWIHQCPLEFR
jgi:hypothetical protein